MATHSSILAWRSTWTVWKAKKIWQQKMSPVQYAIGMRWLNSVTNSMDMNLSKLQAIVEDRGAWLAAVHGVTKRQTWHSNWTATKVLIGLFSLLTQVRVPDLPWGETNWNVGVWSNRKVYCRAIEGDMEKEMATHSSVLAWRVPGTGEPGGLPSMGSHRVRQDWSNLAAAAAERDKVAHTLNCLSSQRVSGKHFCFWLHSAVYGILVPWPGTEPCPLSESMES